MADLHTRFLDKYDFNGLVLELRDKGESPTAPIAIKRLLRSAEQMVRMKAWLEAVLQRHSQQSPLLVHVLSGDAAKDMKVYMSLDERLVFLETGTPVHRDWADLKPAVVGAVTVSAIRSAPGTSRGALPGAQAFARLYNLPLMTKALASPAGSPPGR
jgi:hypothetical protein